MAQNPLLGKRISLISSKNIRYEGVLYSINEQNATVALQNVRSFGTEGREKQATAGQEEIAAVPPSEQVLAFLVFRGQDIKDLHVHDDQKAAEAAAAAADQKQKPETTKAQQPPKPAAGATAKPQQQPKPKPPKNANKPQQHQQQQHHKQKGPVPAVGTGASLLNIKARGAVADADDPKKLDANYDFAAHNAEFHKEDEEGGGGGNTAADADEDEAGDAPVTGGDEAHHPHPHSTVYEKDDFFDSISCDAIDKEAGKDGRLRGARERSLNTETFGAVALNSQRNYYHRRGGGRGGGYGGRGRGRGGRGYYNRGGGSGDGRGRGRGGRGYYNNNNNSSGSFSNSNRNSQSNSVGGGGGGGGGSGGGGGGSQTNNNQQARTAAPAAS